jgi:hypothetical protein
MKRSLLRHLRSALEASGRRAHRRQKPLNRQFSIEHLEPRLVFAVQLASGPFPDLVTVAPNPTSNQFDVTSDSALPVAATGSSTAVTFDGQGLYQTTAPNLTVQSANFVPIDPSKTYALSGWARSGDDFGLRYQPNNQQSFGYTSYDKDHLEILPQYVLRYTESTDSTLADPLKTGDTAIRLTNADL